VSVVVMTTMTPQQPVNTFALPR